MAAWSILYTFPTTDVRNSMILGWDNDSIYYIFNPTGPDSIVRFEISTVTEITITDGSSFEANDSIQDIIVFQDNLYALISNSTDSKHKIYRWNGADDTNWTKVLDWAPTRFVSGGTWGISENHLVLAQCDVGEDFDVNGTDDVFIRYTADGSSWGTGSYDSTGASAPAENTNNDNFRSFEFTTSGYVNARNGVDRPAPVIWSPILQFGRGPA